MSEPREHRWKMTHLGTSTGGRFRYRYRYLCENCGRTWDGADPCRLPSATNAMMADGNLRRLTPCVAPKEPASAPETPQRPE